MKGVFLDLSGVCAGGVTHTAVSLEQHNENRLQIQSGPVPYDGKPAAPVPLRSISHSLWVLS